MKQFSLIIILLLILSAGCSKKLDNISFNDNPYDNDYTGKRVIRIDSIKTQNVFGLQNIVYYTKLYDNNDGERLYKNGTLIGTHYNNVTHPAYFTDVSVISGTTYTYQARLFFGGSEASSDPVVYVTP